MNLHTAQQFVELPQEWVRARMGVTGLRTWNELQGVECISFEQMPPRKQQITISRTFPKEIYTLERLERIVAEFASMCAEKLRTEGSVCGEVQSYLYTNRHREDQPQRYETSLQLLPDPTDSSLEIVRQARIALRQVFSPGYGYKKAGVILSRITPVSGLQTSLFTPDAHEKHARLMKVLDTVNRTCGKGTLVVASQGTEPFRMNREHLSPRYTTSWDELLVVKA